MLKSWQAWAGFLAGFGVACLLAATLVEQQILTPRNKGWIAMLGSLCIAGGIGTAALARRGGRGPA